MREPVASVEAPADDGAALSRTVADLIDVGARDFVDLGFLAPNGMLDVPVDAGHLRSIRLELPPGHALALQTARIDSPAGDDLVPDVRMSSSDDLDGQPLVPSRLFDLDHPTGTAFRTQADRPAWAEFRLEPASPVSRIRLRNVIGETARDARGLRITGKARLRTHVLYDGAAQLQAWRRLVTAATAEAASDPTALALLEVLALTVRGDYARAHRSLVAHVDDEAQRRQFRARVNEALLPARGIEWTVHGPRRPFRTWSEAERLDYVIHSAEVVDALRALTPDVCLGFGSVLSVVRDRALMPHDDDLDVIIAFEATTAPTIADGLRLIDRHLEPLGFEVSGEFATHRHVRRPGRQPVDVFVGIFEDDAIAWYPGARGGLTRAIVFPPVPAELLGVPCLIPAQPETYLERLYGPGWRVPDPYFSHAWDRSAYADIMGAADASPSAT